MKLSILIPSIPQRLDQLKATLAFYESMIEKCNLGGEVELISICDNKMRSIGRKRSDLITISQGEYVVISDDDDRLTRKYFERIKEAMDAMCDVIVYYQFARINDDYTFVDFGRNFPVEYQVNMGVTKRPAWHCCTWRRSIVKDILFGDMNYGEDYEWAMIANARAQSEYRIAEICHIYEHDSDKSAALFSLKDVQYECSHKRC